MHHSITMMKEYIIPSLLIVLTNFLIVTGWQAIEYHVENPFHPGKCYSRQFKFYIDSGVTLGNIIDKQRNYCQRMSCVRGNNYELQIQHAGCPFVTPRNNCKIVKGRKHLPYPLCCSQLDCSKTGFKPSQIRFKWNL